MRCMKVSRFYQFSREINCLTECCVYCREDKIGDSKRDEQAQVFWWTLRKPVCQRIEIGHYTFSPRKENSVYERKEERDYKGFQKAAAAHPAWLTQ